MYFFTSFPPPTQPLPAPVFSDCYFNMGKNKALSSDTIVQTIGLPKLGQPIREIVDGSEHSVQKWVKLLHDGSNAPRCHQQEHMTQFCTEHSLSPVALTVSLVGLPSLYRLIICPIISLDSVLLLPIIKKKY